MKNIFGTLCAIAFFATMPSLFAEENPPKKDTAAPAKPAETKSETNKESGEHEPGNIFEDITEGITGHSGKVELETNAEGQIQDKKDTVKQTVNKFIFNDKHLGISGYMDAFGAYSFNQLNNNTQHPYQSNPLYMDHFGMSYGYISFEYINENVRARLALHGGDMVERKYVGERSAANVKSFREANAGYIFSKHISLDMGIFPSIYGAESLVNRENQHGTRAIMTDVIPDYAAGLRLNYEPNDRWEFKLEVTNGWQNITNNHQKAFGAMLLYKLADKLVLNYAAYLGNEALMGQSMILRTYHNFFTKIYIGNFTILPMIDIFHERRDAENHTAFGINSGLSVRYAFSERYAMAVRYEHIYDPHEILPELAANAPYGVVNSALPAPAPGGFQADGYTLTFEILPSKHMAIRLEGRYTKAKNPIYIRSDTQSTNDDAFFYSSFAVGF